jgi:Calpain family cysteine protease/GRF zinc finger
MMNLQCPEGFDQTVWDSLPREIQDELSSHRCSPQENSHATASRELSPKTSKKKESSLQSSQSMITNWTHRTQPVSSSLEVIYDLTAAKKHETSISVPQSLDQLIGKDTYESNQPVVKGQLKTNLHQRSVFHAENIRDCDEDKYIDHTFPATAESIDGRRVATGVLATYDQSSAAIIEKNGGNTERKLETYCKCKALVKIRQVSKDGPNQGRYFASCILRVCNFFSWADNVPHSESVSKLTWKRFQQSEGWTLFGSKGISGVSPKDIFQGGVGDCWFLSAVAVLAERADLVQKIIRDTDLSGGKVSFKLFLDGLWRDILVDTFLPCQPGGSVQKSSKISADKVTDAFVIDRDGSRLAYSKANHKQLWVPLLEKAYAKAHGKTLL